MPFEIPSNWSWDKRAGLHVILDEQGEIVATIDPKRKRPGNTARFIAALPVMFAAVGPLIKQAQFCCVPEDDPKMQKAIDAACAAIARAATVTP